MQSKIESEIPGKLPVILNKQVVISRAKTAVVDTRSEDRRINIASEEIIERTEVYLPAAVQVQRDVDLVGDDFDARANAMFAARDRERIRKRS